jgi:DNA-directed RNA polymerase beta subunit
VAGFRVRSEGHPVLPRRPSRKMPVTTLLKAIGLTPEQILRELL